MIHYNALKQHANALQIIVFASKHVMEKFENVCKHRPLANTKEHPYGE
jgi:hypothetical protein